MQRWPIALMIGESEGVVLPPPTAPLHLDIGWRHLAPRSVTCSVSTPLVRLSFSRVVSVVLSACYRLALSFSVLVLWLCLWGTFVYSLDTILVNIFHSNFILFKVYYFYTFLDRHNFKHLLHDKTFFLLLLSFFMCF